MNNILFRLSNDALDVLAGRQLWPVLACVALGLLLAFTGIAARVALQIEYLKTRRSERQRVAARP
jgi:hypothetical protein